MESTKQGEGICPTCGSPLELSKSNFNRGQYKRCASCYSKRYGNDWYERNKERVKADSKAYYRQTRARRLEVAKHRRDAMSPSERNKNNREIALKRKYGLTIKQYDQMVADQNGLCFLCNQPPPTGKRLCVDHCHANKTVRKLLCPTCNFFLGIIERDPAWLTRAIEYLKT